MEQPNPKEKEADRELELLRDQMKEAVGEEDYERAAFLRDEIKRRESGETELEKSEENDGIARIPGADNPATKTWDRLREQKQEDLWNGQARVANTELAEYFQSDSRAIRKFSDGLKKDLLSLRSKTGPERVDALLSLYGKKEETEAILELAKEKFNSIWQPYRERAGLSGQEYNEYKTHYQGYSFTGEQLDNLNKVPVVYQAPLDYWQRVYDNSRTMLDSLRQAIDELEKEKNI